MKNALPLMMLATLLLPGGSRAQTAARSQAISGLVHDQSGAAIVGAEVDLNRADGSQITHVITDGAGGFQFTGVPFDSYQIDVKQPGFRETKTAVSAAGGSRGPIRIVLPVAGAEEQITVEASDSSAQVSTEIEQNQTRTQ
jgi:hypothetical protein